MTQVINYGSRVSSGEDLIYKPDLSAFHLSDDPSYQPKPKDLPTPSAATYEAPTPQPLVSTSSLEIDYGSPEDQFSSSKEQSTPPSSGYGAPADLPSTRYRSTTIQTTRYEAPTTEAPKYKPPTTAAPRYSPPSTTEASRYKAPSTTRYNSPSTAAPSYKSVVTQPSRVRTTINRYKPPKTERPVYKPPRKERLPSRRPLTARPSYKIPKIEIVKTKSQSTRAKLYESHPIPPSHYESTREKPNVVLRPAYNPIPTPIPNSFESSRVSKEDEEDDEKYRFVGRPSPSRSNNIKYKTPVTTPKPYTATPSISQYKTTSKPKRPVYNGRHIPQPSAPRRKYISLDSVTIEPPLESPVYRTSTKAYRAPSSLYKKPSSKEEVTAPAQPEFIQSGNIVIFKYKNILPIDISAYL